LVRGPTIVCAILDEVAIWWNHELAANPDKEILRALKPAMITQPGSLLIGLSSPYAKKVFSTRNIATTSAATIPKFSFGKHRPKS
jgi:hypothetical protein